MKFFGECLRLAGCQTSVEVPPPPLPRPLLPDKHLPRQVSGLGERQTYMRKCAAHVIANDCPDTTMCSINCASETLVDRCHRSIYLLLIIDHSLLAAARRPRRARYSPLTLNVMCRTPPPRSAVKIVPFNNYGKVHTRPPPPHAPNPPPVLAAHTLVRARREPAEVLAVQRGAGHDLRRLLRQVAA